MIRFMQQNVIFMSYGSASIFIFNFRHCCSHNMFLLILLG